MNFSSTAAFIWSVADLLRGDFKQSDYGKVILPFTLLRRLECVLEPTRNAVLTEYEKRKGLRIPLDQFLIRKAGHSFYNTSRMNLIPWAKPAPVTTWSLILAISAAMPVILSALPRPWSLCLMMKH